VEMARSLRRSWRLHIWLVNLAAKMERHRRPAAQAAVQLRM